MYADDLARAAIATDVARRPEIRASSVIVRLVDTSDNHYALTLVWEWADVALHELLQEGAVTPADIEAVETNVHAAPVMHALDLVHCDIAPNNILRKAAPGSSAISIASGRAVRSLPPPKCSRRLTGRTCLRPLRPGPNRGTAPTARHQRALIRPCCSVLAGAGHHVSEPADELFACQLDVARLEHVHRTAP
jgi:hypothetical protein